MEFPRIGCEMLVAVNPSGPVHFVVKITGTSTAGHNSICTMQVRLTADLMGRTGLGVADLHITEIGAGTAHNTCTNMKLVSKDHVSYVNDQAQLTLNSDILKFHHCDVIIFEE